MTDPLGFPDFDMSCHVDAINMMIKTFTIIAGMERDDARMNHNVLRAYDYDYRARSHHALFTHSHIDNKIPYLVGIHQS